MNDDYMNEEWIELTPEDIMKLSQESDEIEVDLDSFADFLRNTSYDNAMEEEIQHSCQELAQSMEEALENDRYSCAFSNARELYRIGYLRYKNEIDQCIRICADNDVADAMIYMADFYTVKSNGIVKPEAYKYLKKLADNGYIPSFKWIGDCYRLGIGCDRDLNKAGRYYFEGMLFEKNKHCKNMYSEMHPELNNYQGDDLLKLIASRLICQMDDDYDFARVKAAELILDGMIKEYRAESAYPLLKKAYTGWMIDGMAAYYLGECLLDGIGVYAEPVVALMLLEGARDDIKWVLDDYEGEWVKRTIEKSFYQKEDYIRFAENVERLIAQARHDIEFERRDDVIFAHAGLSEDDIYEEWEATECLYIKRADQR